MGIAGGGDRPTSRGDDPDQLRPNADIGDEGTNTLHILNYVPERVLTLQAELDQGWPEVVKEDASNLMNVIVLESLGSDRSRILSYGAGYRDTPELSGLLQFSIPANEGLLETLKALWRGDPARDA